MARNLTIRMSPSFNTPISTGVEATTQLGTLTPNIIAGGFANLPPTWQVHALDFSQAIPDTTGADVDIPGTDGFKVFGMTPGWTVPDMPGAPLSPLKVWRGHVSPGAYGSPTSGYGIGNVYRYVHLVGGKKRKWYIGIAFYLDHDATNIHPISNKFLNAEVSQPSAALPFGNILTQINEGGIWLATTQEVDEPYRTPIDNAIAAGRLTNAPVPFRQWNILERLVDYDTNRLTVWLNGTVYIHSTSVPWAQTASDGAISDGAYAFWGGGGETVPADRYYVYDHLIIAHP